MGYGEELFDGSQRSIDQLQQAANLTLQEENSTALTLRVINNAGHKLISGFPEGRRMFLNIKFYDTDGALLGEVNPYEPLVTTQDINGDEVYISGGNLTKTNEELVWEAEMSSNLTGENKSFHFALATERYKDNRIPPKGFNTSGMYDRMVQPRWNGTDAPSYFTVEEYAGGYDKITINKPTGTAYWTATLFYQTTSKEYIEFLRDEINGNANTLSSPTPSGEPQAYIIQTDPFFSNLKGWGNAIWDLWLHNNGSSPQVMVTLNGTSQFYIHLEPGYNLISIPYIQSNEDLGSILLSISGDYDTIEWYNISDQQDPWKTNNTLRPAVLDDLHTLNHGIGFWINITNSQGANLIPAGIKPSVSSQILLKPGWNLVGYPSLSNKNRTNALGNINFGTDVDSIWTYDASTGKWKEISDTDYFELGRGYWIHSKVQKNWIVPL
jgi:hypothetical protein